MDSQPLPRAITTVSALALVLAASACGTSGSTDPSTAAATPSEATATSTPLPTASAAPSGEATATPAETSSSASASSSVAPSRGPLPGGGEPPADALTGNGVELGMPYAPMMLLAFHETPGLFEGTGAQASISAENLQIGLQQAQDSIPQPDGLDLGDVVCDSGLSFADRTWASCTVSGTNGAWFVHPVYLDAGGTPAVLVTEYPLADDLTRLLSTPGSLMTWGPSAGAPEASGDVQGAVQVAIDGLGEPISLTSCDGALLPDEGSFPRCNGTLQDSDQSVDVILLQSISTGSGDPVDLLWYAAVS